MDKVAVILLNWRGASDTINCVNSLLLSDIALEDIKVIDNDSQDDSIESIKSHFPYLHIIENKKNGGFAYGCNSGIRASLQKNYDYIWLLNNDTLINRSTLPEMLKIFYKRAERETGIVGSLIRNLDFPYEIQAIGGGSINYLTGQTRNIIKIEQVKTIDYITGASMLISRKVFEKIGLLDENYFMYWEDVEFCVRAEKAGFKIAVATESLVLHKEGASIGPPSIRKTLIQNAAQTRFFRSNSKIWPLVLFINSFSRSVKSILRGDLKNIGYLWKSRL